MYAMTRSADVSQRVQHKVHMQRERLQERIAERLGQMAEEVADEMFGPELQAEPEPTVTADTIRTEATRTGQLESAGGNGANSSVESLEEAVKRILQEQLKSVLHDVTYRLGVLADAELKAQGVHTGRISAHELNLAHHILDGYTFDDDSPTAGSIAWSDANISYKGTTYAITDGDTTDKYVYWELATPTSFQTSNTKPDLGPDDVLVAINDNGTARVSMAPGKMTHGAMLVSGSVASDELGSGAVTEDKIDALAVTEAKIASGAVTNNKIGSGAVTEAKIGSNAVTEAKIDSGAVTETKIGSGAVTNAKIGSSAVDSDKLADNAVVAGKIATGGVSASNQIANGVVDSDQLADSAVISGKIGDGAVTGIKIGAGAVAEDKLNMATHFLF